MGDKSKIEWTDATWNPVTGCTKVSQGCKNCYAETVAERFWAKQYEGDPRLADRLGPRRFTDVWTHEARLGQPLRWTKPRRIFVNSMSDLFHDAVPFEFIAAVFGVMAASPRHTFQILTKRPERMKEWFAWAEAHLHNDGSDDVGGPHAAMWKALTETPANLHRLDVDDEGEALGKAIDRPWPLPNVWIGVSVEDQETANERIPLLLETPATVRFLSAEPLLGPIVVFSLDGPVDVPQGMDSPLHLIIAGGESGRGARPSHPDWFRSLRDQCEEVGAAFFFKQWGQWAPFFNEEHFTSATNGEERHAHAWLGRDGDGGACWIMDDDGGWSNWTGSPPAGDEEGTLPDGVAILGRHGKKYAGRELDGRTHDAYPRERS